MQVTFKVIKRTDMPNWYFVNGFCPEEKEAFNLTGFAGKYRPVLPGKVAGQNEMTLGFRRPDFSQATEQIMEICGDMIDSFYVYGEEPEYERVVELETCEVEPPIEIVPVDASQPVESE